MRIAIEGAIYSVTYVEVMPTSTAESVPRRMAYCATHHPHRKEPGIMPRVAPITGKSDVPAEHHAVVDAVLKVFGRVGGPSPIVEMPGFEIGS